MRIATTAASAVVTLLLASCLQPGPAAGAEVVKPFPTTPSPTSTPSVEPAAAPVQLTGYQDVSVLFNAAAQNQTGGTAGCPAGKQTSGGGADPHPNNRLVSVNASLPFTDGSAWRVYVNNATKQAGYFFVDAVCVASIPGYQVVTAQANNPKHTQTQVTATCPTGTVVYGGGGLSLSDSTSATLNSSFPAGTTGWRVDVNNATGTATTATAYAVCGQRPSGYQIVQGTPYDVGPFSQAGDYVDCLGARKPLSGGIYSNSASVKVSINRSLPSLNGADESWGSRGNNSTDSTVQFTTFAVCALASD